MEIEERIDFYCQIYEIAYQKLSKLDIENSREVAALILKEVAKDLRRELISQLRQGNIKENQMKDEKGSNETKATEKQRKALHRFGIKRIPENLSKKEASDILEELIDLSRHGNKEILKETVENLNKK